MSLISAKNLYVFIILISWSLKAQEKKIYFSAFGKIPTTVDKRYYRDLKNAKNIIEKAKIVDTIAAIHIQAGNTDSILYYGHLLKSLILTETNEFSNQNIYLSKSFNILGKGKLEKGLYDDALQHYLDGISVSPVSTMNTMYYQLQLGLGEVYLSKKEYDQAFPIFNDCMKNASETNVRILAEKRIADVLFFKKEISKAKSIYNKILEDLDLYTDNKVRLEIQLKLGRIAISENNVNQGLQYFSYVKDQALQNSFYDLYIDAVIPMGIIYDNQGQKETAEIVLSTAYGNTISWNKLKLQRDVTQVLHNIYAKNKDFQNAYNLMTQHVRVTNEILTNQNKEIVKEMEIKYQTLQKEKEINKQRTIKKAFLIGFLVILIPVIALLFVYFQKLKTQLALNKSQEKVNSQKVHGLIKDQELNLIKATMDGQNKERKRLAKELHDSIGGNLASIKLQLYGNNHNGELQTKIIPQIDQTYNQVRDISHNLASKKFQNNGLSKLVKEYVSNIQQIDNQVIYYNPYREEEINEIENPLKEELFKILQELLTNALKHAKADRIDIYLNAHETSLQLLFEDNGIGFKTDTTAEGIGFKNIKNRLSPFFGSMVIDSALDRGTVINIEIPYAKV